MSFEQPEKVEKVGVIGKASEIVEAREATVRTISEGSPGPKILFHVVNLEWTILLCTISFIFGGVFGSWILM